MESKIVIPDDLQEEANMRLADCYRYLMERRRKRLGTQNNTQPDDTAYCNPVLRCDRPNTSKRTVLKHITEGRQCVDVLSCGHKVLAGCDPASAEHGLHYTRSRRECQECNREESGI